LRGSERSCHRVVIKIGSSLFYSGKGALNFDPLSSIAGQIADVFRQGREVVIVSSGAIALGMHSLGLRERPGELFNLQAAAAIGQNEVINRYRGFFTNRGITVAQILLTWEDFSDRERYLNAKNTLNALLKYRALPIVNENDTVSTEEIKFGDNDRLSALVASLVSADLLVILSDVDGLLDRDGKVVRVVDDITPAIRSLASPTSKKSCVGGMVTKIEAAKIAVDSGVPCVIANGNTASIVLAALANPASCGTLFLPKKGLAAKQRWIAFGSKPKGRIVIDDGARDALINKKSLLSVGVVSSEGEFEAGDIVSVLDRRMHELARGAVGISSRQLEKVIGVRSAKEVIHRNNLVVFSAP